MSFSPTFKSTSCPDGNNSSHATRSKESLESMPESFDGLGLAPEILKSIRRAGFSRPTPIQQKAIPVLVQGSDIMASACTGSGKTAAFLLPILQRLMLNRRRATRALVLTPTRELAAQILSVFQELSSGTGLRAAAIYGGVSMNPQVRAFRDGVDVIIATPGRLLDHFQYSYARMESLECLVLDEADRMLDMGFLPDVKKIVERVPSERQTMLFSATLPGPILQLAKRMLRDPREIHIETHHAPARGITHRAYPVAAELKTHLLLEILRKETPGSVLAFTRTKHRANRLAEFLESHGVSCTRIHGNRSQAQRAEALAGFTRGRFQVMVATDIVARGLDVPRLDLVVNFDVPGCTEDYIHRVGRTARAEAKGCAYTLVSPQEENEHRGIERNIGSRIPREKLPDFDYTQKPKASLEIPLAERIAAIRARKADDRARAQANAEHRAKAEQTRQGKQGNSFGRSRDFRSAEYSAAYGQDFGSRRPAEGRGSESRRPEWMPREDRPSSPRPQEGRQTSSRPSGYGDSRQDPRGFRKPGFGDNRQSPRGPRPHGGGTNRRDSR